MPRWLHLLQPARYWAAADTGGGQGGEPDPKPGESDKKYSQEELQHSVDMALAKEKARTDKKVKAAVEAAMSGLFADRGISEEELDELVAIKDGKKDADAKASAEAARLSREYKKLTADAEQYKADADRYRKLHQESLTSGAIRKYAAAQKVHDPEDVVTLLRNRVRATEEDEVEVLDGNGDPTHLTVEQLVTQTVADKPYLLPTSTRRGAGSLPTTGNGAGSGDEGPDWSTPEGKRQILQAMDDEGRLR